MKLFINDLPFSMKHCSADFFFADDSTFHVSCNAKQEIESKLQADSNDANNWSIHNKMPINYDKTTSMLIGTRQKIRNIDKLNIHIDDNNIKAVSSQKLLWTIIDENLHWNPHIDYICSTISTRISLWRQLSYYVSENVQKIFYQGYILPSIDYGSNTWGATNNSNIDRLNKLQKRAARIILRTDFTTPSADMF